MRERPIYLDYMATTPVDARVVTVMNQYLTIDGIFGNTSSTHAFGKAAKAAVETARAQVANLINAKPHEIIFTSGATESINLALKGAMDFYQRKGKHIITWQTEHHATLEVCHALEKQGCEVSILPVNSSGLFDLALLEKTLRPDTVLVSALAVNNEIGVIQDLQALSDLTRKHGVLLHLDAVQAAGKMPLDVRACPVDLMSFSGHKVYAPKGIGALFINQQPRVQLSAVLHGSSQECGLRPGTLPVSQIMAMGKAFELAQTEMLTENARLQKLSAHLWQGLSVLPGVSLNGDRNARIPHNINITVAGIHGGALHQDITELAVSAGSACMAESITGSHVLRALGLTDQQAHSSLRLSLGRFTTEVEVDEALQYLTAAITRLCEIAPHDKL